MLEIKSYDDWTSSDDQEQITPVDRLKSYANHVRSGYYKAGMLNEENEKEIIAGVQERALSDNLITDDMSEEDQNKVLGSLVGPTQNKDTDARFVLDHFSTGSEDGVGANDAKVATLTKYLSLKQFAPEQASELDPLVDEVLADKSLIKRAKMSAVDRGDYSVAAIDEDDGGRSLYTGPTAKPDSIKGEIDSLLSSGAISSSDLYRVDQSVKTINGGLSNTSENFRFDMFRRTVGELAKNDKDLGDLIQSSATAKREAKTAEQNTTGEAILEGAKTALAYPFIKLGEAVVGAGNMLMGKEEVEPAYAPDTKVSDILAGNNEIRKKFSAEEIEKFSNDLTTTAAGAVYRADRPETGIGTDSMGNTIIAPQLLANKKAFEIAVTAAPLNKDQQKQVRLERDVLLERAAPDLLRTILDEEPDAVSAFAKAKANGLSDKQFVEQWVGDTKNYDGFNNRLEQFGKSAWKTVAEIPLGLAALSGNEWAAGQMVGMAKDQSRREEYGKLFGDQFGLGFQILNVVPQIATDIALTIGTGGVFAGAKTLAKAGSASARSTLRASAKFALSEVDDAAAISFKSAITAGGEAEVGNAIRNVGASLATKFGEQAPLFAVSFTRSATSTYGSIYGQMPDTMSHDDKHKAALGYAMAAGLSTAVITSGMGLLGRGGVEQIATNRVRAMLAGETDDSILASGGRVVPVDKMNFRQAKQVYENLKNEGNAVTDVAFQKAMRGAIGGTYKNWLRTTLNGGINESVEEALDQGIQIKLEEAALDKETPLGEKVAQVFTAGLIGGALGGAMGGATQFGSVNKSEKALVFEGKASALEVVAKQLRKTNSSATADYVQRMIDDARAKANAATKADIELQKANEVRAESEKVANALEKQLADTPEEEIEAAMLGDLVGQNVTAGGMSGVLEEGDDGMIRMTSKNGEVLNLGSRYEKASGRVSFYPKLMTTAVAQDGIPAGTPYITRGKKGSTRIAMPTATDTDRPENFLGVIRDENGMVIQLVVKNAPMISNPEFSMDVKISNKYHIDSLARYYKVDLESLNDLTPAAQEAVAEVSADGTPVEVVEPDGADDLDTVESETEIVSDKQSVAAVKEILKGGAIDTSGAYKRLMTGDDSKSKFKKVATSLEPQELAQLSEQAEAINDAIQADAGVSKTVKRKVLKSTEELRSRIALAYKIKADTIIADTIVEPDLTEEQEDELQRELEEDLNFEIEEAKGNAPTPVVAAKPTVVAAKPTVVAAKPTVSSVITPEGNQVLPEDLVLKERRKILSDLNSLESARVFKVDRDGKEVSVTLASALKIKELYTELRDKDTTSSEARSDLNARITYINTSIKKGKAALASRKRRLISKLNASLLLDEEPEEGAPITEAEQNEYEALNFILNNPKPVAEAPPKIPRIVRPAGEDWSVEDKLRSFRNQEEESAFNDLVDHGFTLSELNKYGASIAGKQQEQLGFGSVPLFTKQRIGNDPTNPNKYLKGKHILLRREVLSRFPLVEVDTGYTSVKSKRPYTNSEKGTRGLIDLPVYRDLEKNIIGGAFTNDVHVTRAQIDQNIEVYVPEELIAKSKDVKDSFKLNPSIEVDPVTGRVMSVIDPITRESVRFTGDSTSIVWEGYSGYMPVRGKQVMTLLSGMLAVNASKLKNAGATATGRVGVLSNNVPLKEYVSDFINFVSAGVEGEGDVGRGFKLLKKEYGLSDESINDLSSSALADYTLNLHEFAIGSALASAAGRALSFSSRTPLTTVVKTLATELGISVKELRKKDNYQKLLDAKADELFRVSALTERVDAVAVETGLTVEELKARGDFTSLVGLKAATLKDIDSVKVVSNFFASKSIASIAESILERYPKFGKAGSPEAVISKYAEYLFNRVNTPTGDMYTGAISPDKVVRYYGDLYKRMEINSGAKNKYGFGDIGNNAEALDTLVSSGKLRIAAVDPLYEAPSSEFELDPSLTSSRDSGSDFAEGFAEYGSNLRNSLLKSLDESPELRDAFNDIAGMFDKGLPALSGGALVDTLGNLMSNLGGDGRPIALGIVNRLYAGDYSSGLRAAGIMSELGWLPPVASLKAVPPNNNIPIGGINLGPDTSREYLRELISKAKDKAYRLRERATPKDEEAYRELILRGVMAAQPEILAASAKAEEFQRTAELNKLYAASMGDLLRSMDTEEEIGYSQDPRLKVVKALSSRIESAKEALTNLEFSIRFVNADVINEEAAYVSLEKSIAKLSKSRMPKEPDAQEERAVALYQLKNGLNYAIGNLKYSQRQQQLTLRKQDVLVKLIERISPTLEAVQNSSATGYDFVADINAEINKANANALHYNKAEKESRGAAKAVAVYAAMEMPYKVAVRKMGDAAAVQSVRGMRKQIKSVTQQKDIAGMIKYGLFSDNPTVVASTLDLLSKSDVASNREIASLLSSAPEFIGSLNDAIQKQNSNTDAVVSLYSDNPNGVIETLRLLSEGGNESQSNLAKFLLRESNPTVDISGGAYRRINNLKSRQYKAANDVNSEAMERAARKKNTEDMIKYGLQSNDPDSVIDMLRVLSKSKIESHREVANLLLLAPDFIRSVKFGVVDLRTDWAGIFDAGTNTVLINLAGHNGRGLADVLLHEYLHAATVSYFTNPRTAEQREAVTRIGMLRELATVQATKKGLMRFAHVRNALASNEEFLTATLTTPEFQTTLASLTPTGQRSLFGRLVDYILALFGKRNKFISNAIKELLDFSEMSLASFHTYNNSMARDYYALSEAAQSIRADLEDREYLNNLLDDIQNGRPEDFYKASSDTTVETFDKEYLYVNAIDGTESGTNKIDVVSEIQRILPDGITLEFDNTMEGQMGARRSRPNSIIVNPDTVNNLVYGLTTANARSAVRTFVDEELAHLASYRTFTDEDFADIAASMGEDMRNEVADRLYSNRIPDYTKRQAAIAADLASGDLQDSIIAAEWVRSEMTRMAVGRSREENLAFLRTNPSLLAKFLEAVRAFITKLKAQFESSPTASTAAKISMASREFRSMRNGGVLPVPEATTEGELGDTIHFINAVDGNIAEGQEDRTNFELPIASTNPSKVADFWKKMQEKMYDMPLELRRYVSQRDGAIASIEYTMEDFGKKFPKLRDEAINAGIAIEDIGTILGTTAPAVQGEARKELQSKVRQFKADNASNPNVTRLAEDYEAKLAQPIADRFYAEFRKNQKVMEDQLKAKGFGPLVDYLVEFRQEINKYKIMIKFDESNDVYLTRTFNYFTTEGWALAAKKGGVVEIDGKTVDFDKLRALAANHFRSEVLFDAKQEGQTLTEDQVARKTIESLDKYLKKLDEQAAESKELGTLNTVKRDVNLLLHKKDFDEPLRKLLGEVTDPFENAVRTIYNVGRLAANDRFLRNFSRQAVKLELASYERKDGMELLFPSSQNAELGDLAGLYVRSDVAAAVRQELGPKNRDQETRSMEFINSIGKGLAWASGAAVTTQTLGSVGFYPRNILGGMALSAAQGIVNPLYAKESVRLALRANLLESDSKETRDTIRRLVELQILRDDTRGRMAMDMLKGFTASTDEQLDELLNELVEAQATGNISKIAKRFNLKKGAASTVEFLASLNNVIDSAFKVNAYMYELDQLKKAYGTESIGKLEVEAARKTKFTFPTHSDQMSVAKSFNKSPFSMIVLPFVRWKSEVIRTMLNTIPLAMEEINSGNDVMRARGIKRLTGFSATILGGGTAFGLVFGTLFSLLTGGDDDKEGNDELGRMLTNEELDSLREGLPDYQRNHGVFARLIGKDGVQVIDMSNILPYSQVTDIAKLGARGNVKGIGEYIAKDLIGTQIAASALFEVAKNEDSFGNPIALESDNAAQAYWKLFTHAAYSAFTPSIAKKGYQVARYGQQDAGLLIAGELTGARPTVTKLSDIEYRAMTKIKSAMDENVAMLYPLSSARAFDPSDVEGLLSDQQAASNVTQKRLYDFIQGMKSMGSTEDSLIATATKLRISKQRMGNVLMGLNSPWIPNSAWFTKMAADKTRGGEQDPNEIANEVIRIKSNEPDQYSSTIY